MERRHAVSGWRLTARNKLKRPTNYFLFIASHEYPYSFEIYGFAVINNRYARLKTYGPPNCQKFNSFSIALI